MTLNKKWLGSWMAVGIAVCVLVAGVVGWKLWQSNSNQTQYRFSKVEKGPLSASVSASGTVNPVKSVQVGSQVSGQLIQVLVDFNSVVKANQIIARIDPENFNSRVRQAEADLESAKATVLSQLAEINKQQANLAEAERDAKRKQQLVEKGFIAQSEADKAKSVADTATAQVAQTDAQYRSAKAQVKQREALLAQARLDLDKTVIRSPVDGVVIKRSVDSGQTVAASLQAPELFVIAQNLAEMQVEVAIDESDVGKIREGQKATFGVDAFSGRTFEGTVQQVRKAAQVLQNVVTYTVVVSAPNPDQLLLPGMTANVRIISEQRPAVLKIPNSALRFRPPADAPLDKVSAEAAASTATGTATAGGQQGGAGAAKAYRERLVKELQLDDSQQQKLDGLFAAQREKSAASRDLPEEERRKASERNRAELRAKINEFLKPEQQKRYAELVAEQAGRTTTGGRAAPGKVYVQTTDGLLKVINLRLGLSDGSMTEVVSGELKEGDQVITGTISAADAKGGNRPATPAQAGPRLGL